MAINVASGFYVGASLSIDERFVLTKAQMKDMNENLIPDVYFCVCSDDGKLYIYNKNNTVDKNLGKYRAFESSSVNQDIEIDDSYIYALTLNDGTTQNLACDKITQINGEETIEIIVSKEVSKDGTILDDDIISIDKTIKGKNIYSYKYNEEIVDPFV